MKKPPHPGEIIREEVIRPLGLSVTAAAGALGVTRQALSAFLNERSDLSPEMALRIGVALGPRAEVMMGIQTDYDMARARARLPEVAATVRRSLEILTVAEESGFFPAYGERTLEAGDCMDQEPGIRHRVLDYSDDLEVLEITIPAGFGTATTAA
jgi:addiction module HigA family antidote